MKKVLSVILLIFGVGVFVLGSYVSYEAAQGEEKLSQAEKNVQGRRRPLFGPVRKSVNANAAETAQERINEKGQDIAKSQIMANWLHGTGVVIFVMGIGYLAFSFSRKKRS